MLLHDEGKERERGEGGKEKKKEEERISSSRMSVGG